MEDQKFRLDLYEEYPGERHWRMGWGERLVWGALVVIVVIAFVVVVTGGN